MTSGAAAGEQWGWLGVRIRDLTEQETEELTKRLGIREGYGVLIAQVMKDTPAEAAGLRDGDLVVAIDGRPIVETRALQRVVGAAPAGRVVALVVLRERDRQELRVQVGRMPPDVVADRLTFEFGFYVRDAAEERAGAPARCSGAGGGGRCRAELGRARGTARRGSDPGGERRRGGDGGELPPPDSRPLSEGFAAAARRARRRGLDADPAARAAVEPVMKRLHVLVVEDDETLRDLLGQVLRRWGYETVVVPTGSGAVELLETQLFEVAVLDIHLPEMDGVELLRHLKRHDPSIEVLMMTGDPTVATAVETLKLGAYDYLTKPLILEELRHLLDHILERRLLRQEVNALRSRLGEQLRVSELVGVSPAMEAVKDMIVRVAPADSPVLIEGESGTGKELVAAAIHRLSARASGPFITVNCGAVPSDLLESEFFGHVRGAFSGAVADTLGLFRSAHGGTIFLDEVAELPPPLQVKLLRVLQEKDVRPVGSTRSYSVDTRVIAATNKNLDAAIKDGSLRQDLFYRLNVVRIHVPPLRERKPDVPALVTAFIRMFNQRFNREIKGIAPDAMAALHAYEFPGNVRELENLIERAYALGARDQIRLADLPALGGTVKERAGSGGARPPWPRARAPCRRSPRRSGSSSCARWSFIGAIAPRPRARWDSRVARCIGGSRSTASAESRRPAKVTGRP